MTELYNIAVNNFGALKSTRYKEDPVYKINFYSKAKNL